MVAGNGRRRGGGIASDAGDVAWTKWQCSNSCKANNSGDGENALWSLPPGGGAVESRRRRREAVKGGRESMRRWKAERGEKRRRETVERCDVISSVRDGFIQRRGGGKSKRDGGKRHKYAKRRRRRRGGVIVTSRDCCDRAVENGGCGKPEPWRASERNGRVERATATANALVVNLVQSTPVPSID